MYLLYSENKNAMTIHSGNWKRHEENELQHAHETSPPSTNNNINSRREATNLHYASVGDQQFTVNADDINDQPLAYDYLTPDVIATALKDNPTLTDNPAYVITNSDPLLADNPAYIAIEQGSPSAATTD